MVAHEILETAKRVQIPPFPFWICLSGFGAWTGTLDSGLSISGSAHINIIPMLSKQVKSVAAFYRIIAASILIYIWHIRGTS